MTGTEWLVLLGGIAAIGWVNWYFLLAPARPRREGGASRTPPPDATVR